MNDRPQNPALAQPHDIEIEQALLGALMLDNRQFESVSGFLRWHHFAEPLHQRIYDAAFRLWKKGQPANPISLKAFALKDPALVSVGGPAYLSRIVTGAPYAGAAHDLAKSIHFMAKRRDIVEIADTMKNGALDLPVDETPSNLIEQMSAMLTQLDLEASDHRSIAGGTAARESLTAAWDAAQNGVPPGLALGLTELDEALGGAQPGDMIVVAGRPGMGKSAFCTVIADRCSERTGVLYISCEMTRAQIGRRLVSAAVRANGHHLPYQQLRAGKLDMAQYTEAQAILQALDDRALVIDDRRNPSMEQISASARMTARDLAKRGKRLGLVIIDHMQLIQASGDYRGNRVSEMTDISKQIKVLGRDLGLPVIACSQLNRDLENRMNKSKKPILRDLRESGSIEQDADIVLMLYREEYYAIQDKPDRSNGSAYADWETEFEKVKNTLEVIIAKNREGDQKTIKLHCEMAYSAINDWRGFR